MRQTVLSIAIAASLIMNSMPVKAIDDMFEADSARRSQVVNVAPAALEDLEVEKSNKIVSNISVAATDLNAQFDEKVSQVARKGAKFVLDRAVDLTGVAVGGIVTYFTANPELGLQVGAGVRAVIGMTHITDKIADFVSEKAPGVVRAVTNAAYNAGKRVTNWIFGSNEPAVAEIAPAA